MCVRVFACMSKCPFLYLGSALQSALYFTYCRSFFYVSTHELLFISPTRAYVISTSPTLYVRTKYTQTRAYVLSAPNSWFRACVYLLAFSPARVGLLHPENNSKEPVVATQVPGRRTFGLLTRMHPVWHSRPWAAKRGTRSPSKARKRATSCTARFVSTLKHKHACKECKLQV